METCTRFRVQREALGISQRQLAEYAKVPQCYVSNIENGKEVSEEIFNKLSKALASYRDKMYPENSEIRNMYTINLHLSMLNASESINDRLYFCNKVMRDATYIMNDILEDQKAAEKERRNKNYRGYRW